MSDQTANPNSGVDSRIAFIRSRLIELALHRSYIRRQQIEGMRQSLLSQAALEDELAALIEEQRFEAHRGRFDSR